MVAVQHGMGAVGGGSGEADVGKRVAEDFLGGALAVIAELSQAEGHGDIGTGGGGGDEFAGSGGGGRNLDLLEAGAVSAIDVSGAFSGFEHGKRAVLAVIGHDLGIQPVSI